MVEGVDCFNSNCKEASIVQDCITKTRKWFKLGYF